MRKIILTLTAVLTAAAVNAQSGVRIVSDIAVDNSLQLLADISGYGTFTIWLYIDNAENTADTRLESGYPIIVTTDKSGIVLELQPVDADIPVTANYSYKWLQGELDAVPENTVYRLPIAAGRTTTVTALTPAQMNMMRDNVSGFKMWRLGMERNDAVFAMRSGTVIAVEDAARQGNTSEYAGMDEGNSIVVEHADGTMARYSCLKTGSIMVAEGDRVYADTPMALAGIFRDGSAGTRIGVYRYVTNRNKLAYPNMEHQTEFLDPHFMTSDGDVTLPDNGKVTCKTTRKLLDSGKPHRSIWQRIFGK